MNKRKVFFSNKLIHVETFGVLGTEGINLLNSIIDDDPIQQFSEFRTYQRLSVAMHTDIAKAFITARRSLTLNHFPQVIVKLRKYFDILASLKQIENLSIDQWSLAEEIVNLLRPFMIVQEWFVFE